MGCGTWGGNSITENLNYKNFLNITHLVTTIPEDKPTRRRPLFGAYWKEIRAGETAAMNFEEHAGKGAGAGAGRHRRCRAASCAPAPQEAAKAAAEIGPCVVKAQVPTGKRGKAGGIKLANTPQEAEQVAGQILGMTIGDYTVERLLIEQQAKIAREFYAAVLHDTAARKPLILFSTEGGMDIEEIAAEKPDAIRRLLVEIDATPSPARHRRHARRPRSRRCRAADRRYPDAASTPPTARATPSSSEINPLALLARRPRGCARLQIRTRRSPRSTASRRSRRTARPAP